MVFELIGNYPQKKKNTVKKTEQSMTMTSSNILLYR